MIFIDQSGIKIGQFKSFNQLNCIKHFISTRAGGVSKGNYESLNLSMKVNDGDNANTNREILRKALGLPSLIFPVQCHSHKVSLVDAEGKLDLEIADALITATPDICIGVLVADCVPIIFYDKKLHVAGVAHAGWRGTVGLIAVNTIRKMTLEFNSDPNHIIAGIGPSISVDHYEVGEEVIEQVNQVFGNNHQLIKPSSTPGKGYFDLWKANKIQIMETGVPEKNIEISGWCTYSNPDVFFSARRLGFESGRFGAGIML